MTQDICLPLPHIYEDNLWCHCFWNSAWFVGTCDIIHVTSFTVLGYTPNYTHEWFSLKVIFLFFDVSLSICMHVERASMHYHNPCIANFLITGKLPDSLVIHFYILLTGLFSNCLSASTYTRLYHQWLINLAVAHYGQPT